LVADSMIYTRDMSKYIIIFEDSTYSKLSTTDKSGILHAFSVLSSPAGPDDYSDCSEMFRDWGLIK
jgi:hypothetical protein